MINILVSTDNHLGFKEKNPERCNDSFLALEEVLDIPKKKEVDMILLLGDLFDESNTSLSTINRCIEIMDKRIGRKKPIGNTLYLDKPNDFLLDNCCIPTVLIHGNHDLPFNEQKNGSLDILAKAGFVKYIGKQPSYDNIKLSPFVIEKEGLRIGLYPLGFIKDAKLNYLLRMKKLSFEEGEKLHFRLLLVHQNRDRAAKPGASPKNCLCLELLPCDFFHMILWGHEHESIPNLEESEARGLSIYQPGSTIPTSIKRSEGLPKHAGILKFSKKGIKLDPVFLTYQRNIIIEEINFDRSMYPGVNKIEEAVVQRIVHKHSLENTKKDSLLPLLRIKMNVRHDDVPNIFELEQGISSYVANRGEVFVLNKIKAYDSSFPYKVDECIKNKEPLHSNESTIANLIRSSLKNSSRLRPDLKILSIDTILDALNLRTTAMRPALLQDILTKREEEFKSFMSETLNGRVNTFTGLRSRFQELTQLAKEKDQALDSMFNLSNTRDEVNLIIEGFKKKENTRKEHENFFKDLDGVSSDKKSQSKRFSSTERIYDSKLFPYEEKEEHNQEFEDEFEMELDSLGGSQKPNLKGAFGDSQPKKQRTQEARKPVEKKAKTKNTPSSKIDYFF